MELIPTIRKQFDFAAIRDDLNVATTVFDDQTQLTIDRLSRGILSASSGSRGAVAQVSPLGREVDVSTSGRFQTLSDMVQNSGGTTLVLPGLALFYGWPMELAICCAWSEKLHKTL